MSALEQPVDAFWDAYVAAAGAQGGKMPGGTWSLTGLVPLAGEKLLSILRRFFDGRCRRGLWSRSRTSYGT